MAFYEFAGVVNVITKGEIVCLGDGFNNRTVPCPVVSVNGTNHVESALANCRVDGDCFYSGIVTISSNTGNVNLYINDWR